MTFDRDTDRSVTPLARALAGRDRSLIARVEEAVRHRQVRMAFQPVLRAGAAPAPVYHEGLARVLDATGRIIPAGEFMAAIEDRETGRRLDCLALETCLAHLMRHPGLRLAVNLSARSIGYPAWRNLLDQGLRRDGSLGKRLILEITEASSMLVPELTLAFMRDGQRAGLAFALDNFGAGATRFRFLKRFPFDLVKIDGGYVQDLAGDPDNQVALRAFCAMAREFDMLTVAEQVERAEDAPLLTAIGLDCLQGFAFGAPTLRPPWLAPDDPA
ncbi:EAL domain-containing protein [Roseivivax sp. CAU 1761]